MMTDNPCARIDAIDTHWPIVFLEEICSWVNHLIKTNSTGNILHYYNLQVSKRKREKWREKIDTGRLVKREGGTWVASQ